MSPQRCNLTVKSRMAKAQALLWQAAAAWTWYWRMVPKHPVLTLDAQWVALYSMAQLAT